MLRRPVEPTAANLTANSSYSVDLEFTTGDYTAPQTCLVSNMGDMIYVRARVTPTSGSAEDWAVSVSFMLNCFLSGILQKKKYCKSSKSFKPVQFSCYTILLIQFSYINVRNGIKPLDLNFWEAVGFKLEIAIS